MDKEKMRNKHFIVHRAEQTTGQSSHKLQLSQQKMSIISKLLLINSMDVVFHCTAQGWFIFGLADFCFLIENTEVSNIPDDHFSNFSATGDVSIWPPTFHKLFCRVH